MPILFSSGFDKNSKPEKAKNTSLNENLYKQVQHAYATDDLNTFNDLLFENIRKAEATYDEVEIINAYLNYLENIFKGYDHPDLEGILNKTIELTKSIKDPDVKFRAWIAIADVFNLQGKHQKSVQFASKALSHASANDNLEQTITANLSLGKALLGHENITESYQCFLNAKYLITHLDQQNGQKGFEKKLNQCLFELQMNIGNYKKATEYKVEQLRKWEQASNRDSTDLMWLKYELARAGLLAGKDYPYDYNIDEILSYAEAHGLKRLEKFTHALYRNYLIDKHDFETFYKLYHERAVDELKEYKEKYPTRYLVFHAYFKEHLNQMDSAQYYFQKAESLLHNNNDYYKANFYRRWGEFHYRNGNLNSALHSLEEAMNRSEQLDHKFTMLPVSKLLEKISIELGDYKKAFQYQSVYNELNLKNVKESHSDHLLKMQLENQAKENEYLQKQREAEINKKHSAQFFGIAIGIIILMIAVAIISSLKVPAWFIEMLVFFSIVSLFEWIILYMDHEFHKLTHGEPIKMFLIKVVIISFLYPLHHLIEKNLTKYLQKNNLIHTPSSKGLIKSLATIWPWVMSKSKRED